MRMSWRAGSSAVKRGEALCARTAMATITIRPCSKPILTKLPRMPPAKLQTIPGVRQERVPQIACKASHLQSQVVCKTKPGDVRSREFATGSALFRGFSSGAGVVCSECTGSVELYHQHILVFTGDLPWPARVEDKVNGIPVVAKLMEIVERKKKEAGDTDIYKIGAIQGTLHRGSSSTQQQSGIYDVVLFPSALTFQATEADLEDLVESIMSFSKPFERLTPPPDGRIVGEPLAAETHLLVCVHASRDTKCGDIGPELADALETSLPDDGKVRVYRVSHVGGHKFAGNVVIYPPGDWYGNLKGGDTRLLLDNIQSGDMRCNGPLAIHWRGRLGHSKEEQLFLFEKRQV